MSCFECHQCSLRDCITLRCSLTSLYMWVCTEKYKIGEIYSYSSHIPHFLVTPEWIPSPIFLFLHLGNDCTAATGLRGVARVKQTGQIFSSKIICGTSERKRIWEDEFGHLHTFLLWEVQQKRVGQYFSLFWQKISKLKNFYEESMHLTSKVQFSGARAQKLSPVDLQKKEK